MLEIGTMFLVQVLIVYLILFIDRGFTATNVVINGALLAVYSFFLMFFIHGKIFMKTVFMKITLPIAVVLYLFMLTMSEFYFGYLSVFDFVFNVGLVFVITSLSLTLKHLKKYYFL